MVAMDEKFEYKGLWWVPGKSRKKVNGVLTFDPKEGLNLDLNGVLLDIRGEGKNIIAEILLGIAKDGTPITLEDCFTTSINPGFGFSESSVVANQAVIGAHLKSGKQTKLNRIKARFSRIDEWLRISGLKARTKKDNCLVVEYEKPAPITISLDSGGNLIIGFGYRLERTSKKAVTASITQNTYVSINGLKDSSRRNYFKHLYLAERFFSLGILEPIYPLSIEVDIQKTSLRRGRYNSFYKPIYVVYPLPGIPDTGTIKHPDRMLFTFSDIRIDFEKYIKNWYKKSDFIMPVFDLYFGTLYNKEMYLEQRFLNLVQAVEVFHRRNYLGKYQTDSDFKSSVYKKLSCAIPLTLDSDYTKALKGKIKYLNEFSLRGRLKEIFKDYDVILREIVNRRGEFINHVVNTRNYFTHYDAPSKSSAKTGKKLIELCDCLEFIIEVCLLCELGFSKDGIRDIVKGKHSYHFFARREGSYSS